MPKLDTAEKEALTRAIKEAFRSSVEGSFLHRLHAVQLVAQGRSTQEVAHFFNDDASSVARWVRHFRAFGIEGLKDDSKSGRPATLNPDQLRALQQLLKHNPAALGYAEQSWSGKVLATHIEQHYGLSLSVRQCQRLLRELQDATANAARLADGDNVLLLSPVKGDTSRMT